MFLSFIICYFSFPENRLVYKGNYTDPQNRTNGFLLHFYANKTLCPNCARLIFQPNNTNLFPFSSIQLYGIYSSDRTSFFFFGYYGKTRSQKEIIANITKSMEKLNLMEPTDHIRMHKEVFSLYNKYIPQSYCIAFNISNITKPFSTFYSHTQAIGNIFINNGTVYPFKNIQFDEFLYVSEGKIFGLYSSFSIALIYIAWRYLMDNFNTMTYLSQLSVHTFMMHASFDFVYGFFLFQLSDTNIHLSYLFNVIFFFIMIIYVFLETRLLSDVWRVSLGDIENINLWNVYVFFICEITFVVTVYSSAISYVFISYPYFWITIMFSYLLPQIYHSINMMKVKSTYTVFNVIVALAKLMHVFYFTCHKPNLMSTYNPKVFAYATVYLFLQILVVSLQNKFGGSFFLPKRFRPVPFDYRSGAVQPGTECPICMAPIEQGEETMVTPCNHAFHRECLERWMEQELICPMCRTRLPQVEEQEE